MRPKLALILGLLALIVVAPLAGCGEKEGEEALESVEGEPLHLDGLIYNVAITRFLNPNEEADADYLEGQDPEPPDKSYLGVFLTIDNEDEDEAHRSAHSYAITEANDRHYEALESESPYALDIDAEVEAGGEIPEPDTTASAGPIQGAMLLFLVDDDVSEARPLELEIEDGGETGTVELDI